MDPILGNPDKGAKKLPLQGIVTRHIWLSTSLRIENK
jgi:hypothetical protein